MITLEYSNTADDIQRDAQDWLSQLEYAVISNDKMNEFFESYVKDGVMDVEAVNRAIVECHSQVLWKRPEAYLAIIESIECTAKDFHRISTERRQDETFGMIHARILSRLNFFKMRLQGNRVYADTTLRRLDFLRSAFSMAIAQRESKLNFEIAGDQKRLAWAARRDSSSMKGLSLLATILLPSTYLSSIFSTTFFNFQGAPDTTTVNSPQFWIYWAVTIPTTLIIVGLWIIWEQRKRRKDTKEEIAMKEKVKRLEAEIMMEMRSRSLRFRVQQLPNN
ncbi:hypothetical protein GLAREA_08579 [Glarea lozoyensis ATCC 20868]|uniref:Magnesium transport protein CorA, transmembrane region n=1 Tax=Glarea lozoyensis (strain ATCC 20868 / MF5171) TaxID=1116229 RepID=S3CY30_GLAL2|nr:uncharacterized protein GLAREA_08579 [Glarea lozoyensis ATCC 20868]EPE24726.1 hypothetical protein GLAREA_08579 [Glarea lozoyensis ATCC 20868]